VIFLKIDKLISYLIRIDITLGLVISFLLIVRPNIILPSQWFIMNFLIFLTGIYIYKKNKNKTFIAVFIYAFIYFSLVILDMLTSKGIIRSDNRSGDILLSVGLVALGLIGFFIAFYMSNKDK